MTTANLQQIIDHWHLGKIIRFRIYPRYFRVLTKRGVVIVIEYSRQEELTNKTTAIQTQTLKPLGEFLDFPRIHHKDYYYSSHLLTKKARPKISFRKLWLKLKWRLRIR